MSIVEQPTDSDCVRAEDVRKRRRLWVAGAIGLIYFSLAVVVILVLTR
jgi:hypothetical protein